jgi:hypothetical protein
VTDTKSAFAEMHRKTNAGERWTASVMCPGHQLVPAVSADCSGCSRLNPLLWHTQNHAKPEMFLGPPDATVFRSFPPPSSIQLLKGWSEGTEAYFSLKTNTQLQVLFPKEQDRTPWKPKSYVILYRNMDQQIFTWFSVSLHSRFSYHEEEN